MKIGILTFHYGSNFGGFLQAYCLRQAISELGHDCEIINYKNENHHRNEKLSPSLTLRLNLYQQAFKKKAVWERVFEELVEGQPVTDKSKIPWSNYDTIVVGSDVVWDYETEKFGNDSAYFGVVPGGEKIRWVSYGASCGRAGQVPLSEKKSDGLRSFSDVSVRDLTTQNMVYSSAGRTSEIVVDPTWLSNQAKHEDGEGTQPILAFYGYAKIPAEMVSVIREFAKKRELKIVSYGFKHQWADENILVMTPFEWIVALREARCVITGTFHGSLYAIRLGKIFCTLNNPWISNKIKAPFDLVKDDYRLINSPEDLTKQLSVQFERGPSNLFSNLDGIRASSHQFLADSLKRK